jgi:hypothetical protein
LPYKGFVVSQKPIAIDKVRAAWKGQKHSPETRAVLSQRAKEREARKRAAKG